MLANAKNLEGLFKAYGKLFTDAQLAAKGRVGTHGVTLEELAMIIKSAAKLTEHDWLNQLPGMREWIGPRVVQALDFGRLIVVNKDFEQTVGVSVNSIEDDQYGIYGARFTAMGDASMALWMQLAIKALVENKTWADGKPFFAKNRKLKATQAHVITNATTAAFSESAVEAALVAMASYMLTGDRPAEVTPKYMLVGPSLEKAALGMFERELVSEGGSTVSNIMKGRLVVRVSNLLVGDHAGKWFVLGEKNTFRPVAVQQRKMPVLVAKDKPTDDNVFDKNEVLYGTHARGEAFLTMPFLAYAGGLSTVEDAAGATIPETYKPPAGGGAGDDDDDGDDTP